MVLGDDCSPEVAFYSKRKALYIPNWVYCILPVDEEDLTTDLKNPASMLDGLKLTAVVFINPELERSPLSRERAEAHDEVSCEIGKMSRKNNYR